MDAEVAKALNKILKRLNEVELKMEQFLLSKYHENKESINLTEVGIMDMADVLSVHDEAIEELAEIVAEMSERNG